MSEAQPLDEDTRVTTEITYPVICELYARHHENTPIAGLPVVVTDKGTLAGGALAFSNTCHAEADVFRLVEGSRIEDGDTVPAGLDLDR